MKAFLMYRDHDFNLGRELPSNEQALTQDLELNTLRTVTRHVRKVFFVVNKMDLVSAEDRQAVLSSVRETISDQLGISDPRVFAVSARQGLEAKLSGDEEMLVRSGLPELESALTQFLTSERAHVSLIRCIDRMTALLAPDLVERRVGELRGRLSNEALQAIKREWESRMRQIEAECVHAVETLQRGIRSELPSRFGPAIAEHCAEVRESLGSQLDLLLAGREKVTLTQALRELADRAQKIAGDSLHRWVSAHREELERELWTLAAEGVDQLERLHSEALGFAAELFRFPSPAANWGVSRDEAVFSWKAITAFAWRPRDAWELDIFPANWVRKRVRRECGRTLEAAVVLYRDRVSGDLGESGSEWAGRLCSEAQTALKNLSAHVAAAIEGQAPSAVSEKAGALLKRLHAMREELTDMGCREPMMQMQALSLAGERRPIGPRVSCASGSRQSCSIF